MLSSEWPLKYPEEAKTELVKLKEAELAKSYKEKTLTKMYFNKWLVRG